MNNLQSRVETLTTTNALLSEDLARAKNIIVSLQEEKKKSNQEKESSAQEVASNNATVTISTNSTSSNEPTSEKDNSNRIAELEKENDILVKK